MEGWVAYIAASLATMLAVWSFVIPFGIFVLPVFGFVYFLVDSVRFNVWQFCDERMQFNTDGNITTGLQDKPMTSPIKAKSQIGTSMLTREKSRVLRSRKSGKFAERKSKIIIGQWVEIEIEQTIDPAEQNPSSVILHYHLLDNSSTLDDSYMRNSSANKPVILLIPNFPFDTSQTFLQNNLQYGVSGIPLAEVLLMSGYRVLTLDLPSTGLSGHFMNLDAQISMLNANVGAVLGLLDRLGFHGPISIAGEGMGGLLAMKLSSDAPERVSRLILIDSNGLPKGYAPNGATVFSSPFGNFGFNFFFLTFYWAIYGLWINTLNLRRNNIVSNSSIDKIISFLLPIILYIQESALVLGIWLAGFAYWCIINCQNFLALFVIGSDRVKSPEPYFGNVDSIGRSKWDSLKMNLGLLGELTLGKVHYLTPLSSPSVQRKFPSLQKAHKTVSNDADIIKLFSKWALAVISSLMMIPKFFLTCFIAPVIERLVNGCNELIIILDSFIFQYFDGYAAEFLIKEDISTINESLDSLNNPIWNLDTSQDRQDWGFESRLNLLKLLQESKFMEEVDNITLARLKNHPKRLLVINGTRKSRGFGISSFTKPISFFVTKILGSLESCTGQLPNAKVIKVLNNSSISGLSTPGASNELGECIVAFLHAGG